MAPSHKHKTKVDGFEKYDYLYLFALSAGMLSEQFAAKVLLNGEEIKGGLFDISKRIDGTSASLKNESIPEDGSINILFTSIMQDDFDVVWDVAADENIHFLNAGPLMVFGSNRLTLKSLIKYIEEGKIKNGSIA